MAVPLPPSPARLALGSGLEPVLLQLHAKGPEIEDAGLPLHTRHSQIAAPLQGGDVLPDLVIAHPHLTGEVLDLLAGEAVLPPVSEEVEHKHRLSWREPQAGVVVEEELRDRQPEARTQGRPPL